MKIPSEAIGQRLDLYVSEALGITRSAVQKRIDDGLVTVSGVVRPKNYKLREGDDVETETPAVREAPIEAQEIALDVVYEDDDLIVVNKPSGMVVHPAPGNPDGTLVNALLAHCGDTLSGINGVVRPGIVHRIDKDTSGLLAVAKNDRSHLYLSAQLKGHHIERTYYAVTVGNLKEDEGTVDLPIGRHPTDRKKMAVIRDGTHTAREAITHYRVLERYPGYCFVELKLETGRTHQIRVHMSALGHPLLGDPLYGGAKSPFEKAHAGLLHGQCLHAGKLSFRHPKTGETVFFEAPLPADFEETLRLLRSLS